jgi:hypothetical protein
VGTLGVGGVIELGALLLAVGVGRGGCAVGEPDDPEHPPSASVLKVAAVTATARRRGTLRTWSTYAAVVPDR